MLHVVVWIKAFHKKSYYENDTSKSTMFEEKSCNKKYAHNQYKYDIIY